MKNGKIKHFTDLEVWQRSHSLFCKIVADIEKLPHKRVAYILADQIIRSCGLIGGNIAEGFNRSRAKFINSIDIALGEANETENWLYKIRDLGLLDRERAETYIEEIRIICRMLNRLIYKIRERD